jgi:hypothetical protein
MDVLNRKTLSVFNQLALDGIMQGCESVKWPVTTGISTIHDPQSTIHDPQSTIHHPQSTIHDLQGRLLAKAPQRGLFITNGKKYIK